LACSVGATAACTHVTKRAGRRGGRRQHTAGLLGSHTMPTAPPFATIRVWARRAMRGGAGDPPHRGMSTCAELGSALQRHIAMRARQTFARTHACAPRCHASSADGHSVPTALQSIRKFAARPPRSWPSARSSMWESSASRFWPQRSLLPATRMRRNSAFAGHRRDRGPSAHCHHAKQIAEKARRCSRRSVRPSLVFHVAPQAISTISPSPEPLKPGRARARPSRGAQFLAAPF
jgi:hypothetical protein